MKANVKFDDLAIGHTVIAQYKKAEYSSVFQMQVAAISPNGRYLLIEYKYWDKGCESHKLAWDSCERLDNVFEIVDFLGTKEVWYLR
jgi:hypothetical protein